VFVASFVCLSFQPETRLRKTRAREDGNATTLCHGEYIVCKVFLTEKKCLTIILTDFAI